MLMFCWLLQLVAFLRWFPSPGCARVVCSARRKMFRACILLSRAAGTTPAVINREKSSPRALLAAGRGVVDDRAPYAAPPVHNLTAHASRTLSLARRDRTNIQCPPALERNINAKVSPSVCAHKTRASSSATL